MTATTRLLPVALGAALAAGACTTTSVRRAALVPHMQPTMRDGQPMNDAIGELGVGVSTLVQTHAPSEGNTEAGVWIPRLQANGALRFQPIKDFDMGLIYEQGFKSGAKQISPDIPEPHGDAYGLGLTMGYSIPTGEPGLRIGVALDLIRYSVPYVEYRTCVDFCGGVPWTEVDRANVGVGVVSLGFVPSYNQGPWTVFGSLTLRNHPTVQRGGVEVGVVNDEDVESGPMNAVLAGGASYTLPARVKLSMIIYQSLSSDPVNYGPTMAASFTLPFGNKKY